MLIIQPDVELMKHNYYHYAYHTGTENYSLRRRWGGRQCMCLCKIHVHLCTQHETKTHERHGRRRGGEGGWRLEEWSHHHARRPRNKSHLF